MQITATVILTIACIVLPMCIWSVIPNGFKDRLKAIGRIIVCKKYHLITYTKGNIQTMNSAFSQEEIDMGWLEEGCNTAHDLQQADSNVEYFKHPINFTK